MAVFYRLSQVTSPKQKGYGKWYPRAVMTNTVDTSKPSSEAGSEEAGGNGSSTGGSGIIPGPSGDDQPSN